jgi:methylase of polypeptide subunit release factors
MLAEKFPKSRFTGYDLSEEAIAYARETGFKNVEVMQLEHDFQNYYYIVRKS